MQSEKDQLDEEAVNLEVERIKLVFEKEKYDDKQKRWFIEAKIIRAKKANDVLLLRACDLLLDELK